MLHDRQTGHCLTGNHGIDGQLSQGRLLGQLLGWHHGAELGFDLCLLFAGAQSCKLLGTAKFLLALARMLVDESDHVHSVLGMMQELQSHPLPDESSAPGDEHAHG